jgi:hypothetical protein
MNIAPSLELGHLELHFAENTDTVGVCCCWSSKAKKPHEYIFDGEGHLVAVKKADKTQRAISNAKLNEIIMQRFEDSPLGKEEALKALKSRLDEEVDAPHIPITRDRIMNILKVSIEFRKEMEDE